MSLTDGEVECVDSTTSEEHPKNRTGLFAVSFSPISKTLTRPYVELFPAYKGKGLVRGEPGGFVFSPEYGRNARNLFDFEPRKEDVWLMSFPRSGA